MRTYTALAYGNLLMLSLSGACVTVASTLLNASRSIRYVTKYTKLSPSRFLGFSSYMALWIDFGIASYISPFNCIVSICYYFFSGNAPPAGNFFTPGDKTPLNMGPVASSLASWIVALLSVDTLLLRKMRGIGIEEMRMI